ncbi:MAG: hypothetical protein WCT01_02925 [Candidatus Shapirobacteria bacterium]
MILFFILPLTFMSVRNVLILIITKTLTGLLFVSQILLLLIVLISYPKRNLAPVSLSQRNEKCLPIYASEAYSYYYDHSVDDRFQMTTSQEESDEFIHNLCENCQSKEVKYGRNSYHLWFNPNSNKYISIVFKPSGNYCFTNEIRIDNLNASRDEIEMNQAEVDSWLESTKNW